MSGQSAAHGLCHIEVHVVVRVCLCVPVCCWVPHRHHMVERNTSLCKHTSNGCLSLMGPVASAPCMASWLHATSPCCRGHPNHPHVFCYVTTWADAGIAIMSCQLLLPLHHKMIAHHYLHSCQQSWQQPRRQRSREWAGHSSPRW